jgi:hypothetical protein
VTVDIVDIASRSEPPGADVRYVVRNDGPEPVWVVDDGFLVWRQGDHRIELSFARAPMQPGVEPFGYFSPQVVPLGPGEHLERTASLTWPQRLSGIWNEADEAAPAPGEYEVAIRVGYGESPEPGEPELGRSVEEPVLAWQREAVSAPARLVVS